MISASQPLASWFLWIGGGFFLAVYALPLLLWPMGWARVFRWKLPEERRLAVYLGRCVGSLAVAVVGVCFRAAPAPERFPAVLELVFAVGVLMTIVHVWGLAERSQPWTEHAEIPLYAGLAAIALWLRLGL